MPISSKNNKTLSGTNLYTSSGTAIKPTITYNNGGTVTIGEGVFRLFHLPNYIGVITEHTISETTLPISDNITNYIVASYNSGSPEYSVTTNLSSINFSDSVAVYTIFRIGDTNVDILDWDEPAYSLSNKLLRRDMETRRFERISGLNLSEDTGRKILISSGAVWQGSYRNSRIEVNSIDNNCILVSSNALGEYEINSITAYNNTQYDTGTGIATVSDDNYIVNWIYRGMGKNADSIIVYLGTDDYDINEAKSAQPPNILLGTSTNAMLVGKIIVQKASDIPIQIDSAFQTLFAPASASNGVVIGSVQMFAGSVAPSGYQICNGSELSRTTYSALFNVIGTTYGVGNGSTTFNLPDLRSRIPIGAGQSIFTSTFAYTDVNINTNEITVPNNDSLQTGVIVVLTTSGTAPGGLTTGSTYYIIRISATSIKLANSLGNAVYGTNIDITGQGTGNHTLTVTYSDKALGTIGGEETHALTNNEMPSHQHYITGYVRNNYDPDADAFQSNLMGLDTGNSNYYTNWTGGSQSHNNLQPYLVMNYIIKY